MPPHPNKKPKFKAKKTRVKQKTRSTQSKPHRKRSKQHLKQVLRQAVHVYEVELLRGLAGHAEAELKRVRGVEVFAKTDTSLSVRFAGEVNRLLELRTVVAVYRVATFDIPRPKALLGDAHFRELVALLSEVVSQQPKGSFAALRFGAAGSDSPTFRRLAESLSKALKLPYGADEGDLFIRFRPTPEKTWELLVRLTPRPLSARAYRVCNRAGGLSAALAAVTNDLTRMRPQDRYLNAMCGSGTLAIERALAARAQTLSAIDIDETALNCAAENIAAAGLSEQITLAQADATALPFAPESFNVITADVPWGDAVGTHANNSENYPKLLKEFARVATQDARLAFITHELKLFEKLIKSQTQWRIVQEMQVFHGGHHPKVYLLLKNAARS